MKIEIAENMLYSWLRHCIGCQIVQTNYKVAQQWKKTKNMKRFFDDFQADKRFKDCHFKQKFPTILNTTECDLVGILFGDNNATKIFAYESAFHESGVHYSRKVRNSDGKEITKNVTPQKVTQKIFKNYLMARSFFPDGEVELAFVSPVIEEKHKNQIDVYFKDLANFITEHKDTTFNLVIFTGNDFKEKIWEPLRKIIDKIADESELFVRAVKLLKMTKETE